VRFVKFACLWATVLVLCAPLSESLRKPLPEYRVEVPESGRELWPYLYWYDHKATPRFYLPPHRLVMHGAYPYAGGWNPLVAACGGGPQPLAWFYGCHQPANLAEMYRLPLRGEPGEALPPWELPWLAGARRRCPSGEAGLGIEHGVSYYGPATPEKIALECRRLREITGGICAEGFRPDRYGDIEGYFMRSGDDDFRFFVRGGKHRAAALVALSGDAPVPVTFKTGWPRVINRADVAEWPLIHTGQVSVALALAVFDRYFEGNPVMAEAPAPEAQSVISTSRPLSAASATASTTRM